MKAKKMRICFAIITVLFMLFTVSPLSLPMPVEALGEGGTPAPAVYINGKGQVEIRVKFYLIDEEDGEAIPVKNLQFAACAFIQIPGIPVPVHFYNFDDLTGKGANPPSQYFYNLDEGITTMPILLAEQAVPLLDFAKQAKMDKVTIGIYQSRGFASEGRNYIKDDNTWFQIDITLSDDKESIQSYQLYRINTDSQELTPIEEKDFAFINKIKTLPLSVTADISLVDDISQEKQAMQGGEFEFALYDQAGQEVSRARNTADGKIAFPNIKFSDEEEHQYTVKQIADPNNQNILYDQTVYTIKAQAKEKWSNDYVPPEFKSVKYFVDDQEVEQLSFTNKIRQTQSTLTFNPDGGNWQGSTANKVFEVLQGTTFTIIDAPVRDGYVFQYWQGSKYQPGDQFTVEGDHNFTAIWSPVEIPEIIVPVPSNYKIEVQEDSPIVSVPTETVPIENIYRLPATGSADSSISLWIGLGLALSGLLLKKQG